MLHGSPRRYGVTEADTCKTIQFRHPWVKRKTGRAGVGRLTERERQKVKLDALKLVELAETPTDRLEGVTARVGALSIITENGLLSWSVRSARGA